MAVSVILNGWMGGEDECVFVNKIRLWPEIYREKKNKCFDVFFLKNCIN